MLQFVGGGFMRVVTWLALSMLGGCAFISPKEQTELEETIDADADGVPAPFDCDDEDPRLRPTNATAPADAPADAPWRQASDPFPGEDIPGALGTDKIDGIDNDCDGFDKVDFDGDGFPLMSREAYDLEFPDGAWPVGLFSVMDCDDSDATINPQAVNTPYDGINSNCVATADEFDVDRDGYHPDTDGAGNPLLARVNAYYAANPGLPPLQSGDCDDNDDGAHPGVVDDVWYDGLDANCDRANDYDADRDGYVPAVHWSGYLAYVELIYPGVGAAGPSAWHPPGESAVGMGDCLDCPTTPAGALCGGLASTWVGTEAAGDVNAGAADLWYDGIDSNCDGANDFDRDGDGVAEIAVTLAELESFGEEWGPGQGYPNTVTEAFDRLGDCDDLDPDRYKGQLEAVLSAVDFDCDGDYTVDPPEGGARSAFANHDISAFSGMSKVLAFATEDRFLIATTADEAVRNPGIATAVGTDWTHVIGFPGDTLAPEQAPSFARLFANITPDGTGQVNIERWDAEMDGDTMWSAVAKNLPDGARGGDAAFPLLLIGNMGATSANVVEATYPSTADLAVPTFNEQAVDLLGRADLDVDLEVGQTSILINTVSAGQARLTRRNNTGIVFTRVDVPLFNGCMPGSCFGSWVDDSSLRQCSGSDCVSIPIDPSVPSLGAPVASGPGARKVFRKDGIDYRVAALGAEVGIDGTTSVLLGNEPITDIEVVHADTNGDGTGDLYFVVALVNDLIYLDYFEALNQVPDTIAGFQVLHTYDTNDLYSHRLVSTGPLIVGRDLRPTDVSIAATQNRLVVGFASEALGTPVQPRLRLQNGGEGAPIIQDGLGWFVMSFYPDLDGDGFPSDPSLPDGFRDCDDHDVTIAPGSCAP